jgi:4-amino-4-deoxy-L-arabinose transferase-like glycosyltransferase
MTRKRAKGGADAPLRPTPGAVGPTPRAPHAASPAAAAPAAPRETPRALSLLALVGAAALALLAVVPWRFGGDDGGLVWDLLADPTVLSTGGGLQSPLLVSFLILWLPLSGVAVLLAMAARRRLSDDVVAAVATAAAVPPLLVLFAANPTFGPSPHEGLWDRFVALPVAFGVFTLVAGLATLRRRPDRRAARFVAGGGAAFVAAATLLPVWGVARWHWPLLEYGAALGSGTIAGSARGVVALSLFLAAAATLLTLPYAPGDPARDARRSRVRAAALWLAAAAYPAWFALLALDAAAAGADGLVPAWPRALLAVVTAAWAVWALVLVPRLVLRADDTAAGAGWRAPGWIALRDGGLKTLDLGAIVVVFGLFFLLKTHGLRASATDENIYFYGAELIARGELPYRDFFFAHPPGHLLVPAAFFAVFGFSLTLAKLIPVVATMVTGAFVLAIARVHIGRLAGLAALVAFLFANEVLKASTNLTGINLTTMWLTAGLWAALARRHALAGALLGAAVCTGFYAIAGALAVLAITAFAGRPAFVRSAVAFVVVAGGVNALFYAIGGEAFIEGVYAYHGKKPQRELLNETLVTLHYHAIPLWCFALAPLLAVGRRLLGWTARDVDEDERRSIARRSGRDPATTAPPTLGAARLFDPRTLWGREPEDAVRVAWLVTLALMLEFTLFRELFSFYFTLWFPTLAILVGYAVAVLAEALRRAFGAAAGGVGYRRPAAAALVACLAFAAWLPVSVSADATLRSRQEERLARREIRHDTTGFLAERRDAGKSSRFTWSEPPLLPELGDVVRVLFWREERVKGTLQPGTAWYLQSKKRWFETADEIAAHVREHSQPGETVTGASTIAPLIALLSGRDLAAQVMDTNTKRFKAGTLTREDFWEAVCHDRVKFVIAAPNSFFAPQTPSNHPTVDAHFRAARLFRDQSLKNFGEFRTLLFERTTPDAPRGEPVCRYVGEL